MIIFLTIVGAALLALLVVVVYLNDRVNELERRTGFGPGGGTAVVGGGDDNTWRGLSGKRLWDAMAGKKGVTPLADADLDALRLSYEGVLSQHIESLFRSGQSDARRGSAVQPTAVKTLASPRGTVQSWIPLNHANALYRAGMDSTKADIYETERARMTLDETAQVLYAQTGLSLSQPFSDLLLGNGGELAPAATAEAPMLAGAAGDGAPSPSTTAGALGSGAAVPLAGAPPTPASPTHPGPSSSS
ncbi:MAG: hypothetical protein EBR46_03525 [Betaproteobacteria bacterium]|nr:hypothetical protein [Betaproteobacteria bacterium]